MIVDKCYCMSSFLMFRTIADKNKCFADNITPNLYSNDNPKILINNSKELLKTLQEQVEKICKNNRVTLALSGGIDSAILARFMPKGSVVYTFQCKVPGVEVTNEVPQAKKYADECGLKQEVIEIYWSDFEKYLPVLMKHKGAPIHSIEIQIYKAALKAKKDGFDTIIFGETADINYGGFSDLLSKDRTIGEFLDRYSFVKPYYALKKYKMIMEPYLEYEKNGYIDTFNFCRNIFLRESMGSYTNACQCANINLETPFANTYLNSILDLQRIRAGENKYMVREVFQKLYPGFDVPPKTPMPRPMDQWLEKWQGPTRNEFWPHCQDHMTGDQKWLIYCLEKFLDLIDNYSK